MKTVSQTYKAAQASNLTYPVRKVELFRRLADSSGWEAAAIDITAEVTRLDRLSWKLDTDTLNEFKASNISIEVDNSSRIWDNASPGRFAGFQRFHSKIQISLGLKLSGTDEIFPVFTGVLEDVIEDSDTPTAQLDTRALDQLLEDADGNNAAVLVTNELLGLGDGLKSEFELAQTPVGLVKEVRVGGEVLRPGTRWSTSNLNDPQLRAKITFEAIQPAVGAEIRADYIVWKRDKQIHDVVNDLLNTVPQIQKLTVETASFDPPAQRELLHTCIGDFTAYSLHRALITPETEPPEGDGAMTIDAYDTLAKWQSAVSNNRINFYRIANGIHPRWTSQYEADYEPAQEKWTVEGNGAFPWFEFLPSGTTATLAGSVRTVTHAGGSDYVLQNSAEEFTLSRCVCARIRFSSISGTVTLGTMIQASPFLGAQIEFLNLNQVRVRTATTSANYNVNLTQFHTFRLALTLTSVSAGTWALFVDGTQVLSGTLGAFPSGTSGIRLQSSGSNTLHIDYLRYNGVSPTPATGELTLKVDYGPQLAGLTTFSLINTLGAFFAELQGLASGAQFSYSWSADDYTYSAETAITNGGNTGNWTNVQSPRYIKFRIVLTDTLESLPFGIKRLWLPAIAESPLIDGGSGIVSWDTWKAITENNNGSVQRFTAAGANSQSGFSFHRALGPNDTIISDEFAVSQGFPLPNKMAFITVMNTSGVTPPLFRLSVITLTTRNILISMANFASRSVLDIIKELAGLADFEIGLNGEGKFFFRNKTAAVSPVLTLDDSNIEKASNMAPGWDRVYNSIRATFGKFLKTADSTTEAESPPTSIQRFGVKPLSVGGGSLVFQNDVDLATVMAKRYFLRYKEPKRRATVTTRFMPELELGDRVTFSVQQPRSLGPAYDARVLGIAQDLMNFRTELDLMEV
ncbi:MAG: hypothetical protein A2218_10390 [Elusimicrobia bacterium RIFOXYA2_FULL_53_38]|nr:MAG: hypothetical protein A2218_10390 [Elusimicrobia bacterium RIFOXYA2_FULL_53_38]